MLNSTWVLQSPVINLSACANSTSNPRTRAERVVVSASVSSRGGVTATTTIRTRKPTTSLRQFSGSEARDPQRSESHVSSQSGSMGLQPSHRHPRARRLYTAAGESGAPASSLTEKLKIASPCPNLPPVREDKSPRRSKRFLRRCMSSFTFRVPPFSSLFPVLFSSCVSDTGMST